MDGYMNGNGQLWHEQAPAPIKKEWNCDAHKFKAWIEDIYDGCNFVDARLHELAATGVGSPSYPVSQSVETTVLKDSYPNTFTLNGAWGCRGAEFQMERCSGVYKRTCTCARETHLGPVWKPRSVIGFGQKPGYDAATGGAG
jgi:hypothetical protein